MPADRRLSALNNLRQAYLKKTYTSAEVKTILARRWGCHPHHIDIRSEHVGGRGPVLMAVGNGYGVELRLFGRDGDRRYQIREGGK